MFDGEYTYDLVKEKMETAIRAREHDRLVKQVRSAGKGPHKSMAARAAAFATALFK